MRTLRPIAMLAVLALASRASAQTSYDERPNVVLIVADDLGWGDVGAHGQARIATPHFDRLAREGMRFTQAYAGAPVCAPSRCVLLTGLHGGHCPVGANQYPNATLRVDEVTLADVLRGAGYHTAIAGKWGLGGELADGTGHQRLVGPWAMGFDRSFVVLDQGLAAYHWPEWLWADGERIPLEGNVEDGRAQYAPEIFVQEALRQIEHAARRGRPFFVLLSSTLPHRELIAADEGRYAGEDWPPSERAYAAMVTLFDEHVGRVVDRIDALGLAQRTLVLVASDNGPTSVDGHDAAFFASSGPLRGGKRDLTEGGIRVPLVARWPGVVPAGSVREVPVGFFDLLPTLAELAGAGVPSAVDGTSIARVLTSDALELGARDLVWTSHERAGSSPSEPVSRVAVRRGDAKLVVRADDSLELYDLASDPGERVDLSSARPELVRTLHEVAELETTGAVARVDPVLRVAGEGVRDDAREPRARARPVLWARLDRGLESLTETPSIALRGPARTGVEGARLGEGAHVVAGPHPALAIGATSVTIEASVRLANRGASEGPRWLLVAKPAGRDDRFVDYGVLARAGVLEGIEWLDGGGAPDGIAVVLGDRRPRVGGAWGLRSTLHITDDAWHQLAVRIDREGRRVVFDLDGQREILPMPARDPVLGEGLLHVGTHPGASGAMDGPLEGWVQELRISRGVVEDDALAPRALRPRPRVDAVLDLGRVVRGGPPLIRRVRILDGSPEISRAMEGHVELTRVDDPRLRIDAPDFAGLVNGAGRGEILVTLDPTSVGRLHDQQLTIVATVARVGTPARRSPLVLRIEGEVVAPRPLDGGIGQAPGPSAPSCDVGHRGALTATWPALAALLLAARRRLRPARRGATRARDRDASARARARSR